jgi:hypothetical protein
MGWRLELIVCVQCVVDDEKVPEESGRKIGRCDCHCRNARQVGNLGEKTGP